MYFTYDNLYQDGTNDLKIGSWKLVIGSSNSMRTTLRIHSTAFILILLLGGIVYLNSLAGSFQWDDIPHIIRNPAIYNWKNIAEIFHFWPTRFFLFWTLSINYHFSGTGPFGYHLVNTVIHILSAFLVYLIFFRLRRKEIDSNESIYPRVHQLALLGGLLFLVHPIQTQAVTFIVQRGASLSGFFCLLALYLYCRSRQDNSRICYGGALAAGILGIFSKEGAAALPLLIGLWELFFGPEGRRGGKLVAWLPFAVLPLITIVTIGLTASGGEGGFYYSLNLQQQLPSVGLTDSTARLSSRWIYLITQFRVLLTYIRLILLPIRQTIYYDFPVSISIFQALPFFSLLILLSLIFMAVRLTRARPVISFGIFFFFISLLPTSSLVVLLPLVSEHHLYLALAGLAWAGAAGLGRLLTGQKFMGFAGIIIISFSLLAITRNLVWLNPYTLWSDACQKAPHLASLHDSLSSVYIEAGRYEEAIKESRRALELDPDYNAYHNLWAAYHNLGNYALAEETARRYLRLFPHDPQPHQALALTMIETGNPAGAERELLTAINLQPSLARPHLLLGGVYRRAGKYRRAEEELREAITLAPYMPAGYDELGSLFEMEERWSDATTVYREALRVKPDHIRFRRRLAVLIAERGEKGGMLP